MLTRLYIVALLALAACQPAPPPPTSLAPVGFPTMTPGRVLVGALPTAGAPADVIELANPATAVALASRPTATPDYAACPSTGDATLGPAPNDGRAMIAAMAAFLSRGGDAVTLERGLRESWGVVGAGGTVRADMDLSGEGVPEVLVSFSAPDDGGTLALFQCAGGRYTVAFRWSTAGAPPQLVQVGDMNFDARPDILATSEVCAGDACAFHSQLVTWSPPLGHFVTLLDRPLESASSPSASDVDADNVAEIVARQDDRGDAESGPRRTGLIVYDWNGAAYVESVTQLDPPRFRIQVIHEADRALEQLDAGAALEGYEQALESPELEPWRNDETPVLRSYALFKRLQAHAYLADNGALGAYQALVDEFPDPAAAPVFVPLAASFWNVYQETNNLRAACDAVRVEIEAARPEAVDLMNRYGSESPVYSPTTICPF